MKQGLGRYATAVEANAAEPSVLFDQRYLLVPIRRIECGGVTTGSRSQHNDFGFDGLHRVTTPQIRFARHLSAGIDLVYVR